MRIGEHHNGGVQLIEGRQVLGRCECGWGVRIPYDDASTTHLEEAKDKATALLQEHMSKHNENPDTGVQLSDEEVN